MSCSVYSCIVGPYDNPDPYASFFIPGGRPVLFTDLNTRTNWSRKPLVRELASPVLTNRYHKFILKDELDGDILIYVDGNIRLKSSLDPIIRQFIQSGADMGLFSHPVRHSLQQEFTACKNLNKLSDKCGVSDLFDSIETAKLNPYLSSVKLTANNIIFRKRSTKLDEAMIELLELLPLFFHRDQLLLPLIVNKFCLSVHYWDFSPYVANPFFRIDKHNHSLGGYHRFKSRSKSIIDLLKGRLLNDG